MFGLEFAKEEIEMHRKNLRFALKTMETIFLKERDYLSGDEISIADISVFNEILQLKYLDYDLTKYPKIMAWYDRINSLEEVQKIIKPILFYIDKYKMKAKI